MQGCPYFWFVNLRVSMARYTIYFLQILLVSAVSAWPLREVYSFDLGWRTTVSTPPSCDQYSAPLVDILCDKVTYYSNVTSADACQAVACTKSVPLWQFCDGISGCGVVTCGVGVASQCRRKPGLGWIGAMRNASFSGPPASAPETQPGFDDSLWQIVDAPHDAMISGSYSRAEDPNWAFLPEQQYWYRKHFSLPQAWQGAAIVLEIEGASRIGIALLLVEWPILCFFPCYQAFCRHLACGSMASESIFRSRTATCP